MTGREDTIDIVGEMFGRFNVKPKPVSMVLYKSVIIELYSKGYVSLSELAEHMDWIDAYSVLYWVARELFPHVGIMVEAPSEDNIRGEIKLFVNINKVSEHICETLGGEDGELLEYVIEKIEERAQGNKQYSREELLDKLRSLAETCKKILRGEPIYEDTVK